MENTLSNNGHSKVTFGLLERVRRMETLLIQAMAEQFVIKRELNGGSVLVDPRRNVTVQKGPPGSYTQLPSLRVKDLKEDDWLQVVDPDTGVMGICLVVFVRREEINGYIKTEGYNSQGARDVDWDIELDDLALYKMRAMKVIRPEPQKPKRSKRPVRQIGGPTRMGMKIL